MGRKTKKSVTAFSSRPPASGGRRPKLQAEPIVWGFADFRDWRWLWLLAGILRIATLTRNALWYDELMNLRRAKSSLEDLLASSVHWLHSVVLQAGLAIQDGALGLRLFPLLFGIAAFPLFCACGALLAKRAGAISFGILFALSQFHIFYSQDGNYYSAMMFYTVAATYLTLVGLINGRLWLIFLSIFPHALSFLTHPFSGLFFAFSILAAAFAATMDAALRDRIIGIILFWRQSTAKTVVEGLLIAAIAGGIYGCNEFIQAKMGTNAFALVQTMAGEASGGIHIGAMAWNMELSPYFFSRTLRELGPSYLYDNMLVQIAAAFFLILWIAGLAFCIRKRAWSELLLFLPLIGTYVFLFNFDPGRFFHIRYASYLCPIYLAGVALGALRLGRFLPESTLPWLKPLPPQLLLVLLVSTLTIPSLIAYYFRDGANWKSLAQYLEPRLKKDSALIYYNEREGMQAEFYARQNELPMEALTPTRHTGRMQQEIALAAVKRAVVTHPSSWFFTSWVEPVWSQADTNLLYSPLVGEWVRKHFIKVLDAPSAEEVNPIPLYRSDLRKDHSKMPPVQSAVLYQWALRQRYLYAPYPLTINLESSPLPTNKDSEENSNLLQVGATPNSQSWAFPLLVETTGNYRLTVDAPPDLPASGTLTIELPGKDGFTLRSTNSSDYALFRTTGLAARIPQGMHHALRIAWSVPAGERFVPLALKSLRIMPDWQGGFSVPALHLDYLPESAAETMILSEKPVLKIRGCRMARYHVETAEPGTYLLQIRAGRSKPDPAAMEIWLDDKLQGVLPLMQAKPLEWENLSIPLSLTGKAQSMDILFLQNLHDGDDESQRNELILESFALRKAGMAGDGRDDRLPVQNILFAPPEFLKEGFAVFQPFSDQLPGPPDNPYWLDDPPYALKEGFARFEPGTGSHSPILRLEGRPRHGAVNVRTALFRMAPGELMHFSFRIRSENLHTHSANAQVWYFGEVPELATPLRKDWANIEHSSGTTPWERWSYFDRAPVGTVFALVTFSIFNQGNPEWLQRGSALYQDFEWCVAPEPAAGENPPAGGTSSH